MTYYGPDWLKPYAMATWYPDEWLSGPWTKEDQSAFNNLYDLNVFGFRPYGKMFDDILNSRSWDFYSGRHNISYSDIQDPRKYKNNFGGQSNVSYMLQISRNVKDLYK